MFRATRGCRCRPQSTQVSSIRKATQDLVQIGSTVQSPETIAPVFRQLTMAQSLRRQILKIGSSPRRIGSGTYPRRMISHRSSICRLDLFQNSLRNPTATWATPGLRQSTKWVNKAGRWRMGESTAWVKVKDHNMSQKSRIWLRKYMALIDSFKKRMVCSKVQGVRSKWWPLLMDHRRDLMKINIQAHKRGNFKNLQFLAI